MHVDGSIVGDLRIEVESMLYAVHRSDNDHKQTREVVAPVVCTFDLSEVLQ